MPNHSTTQQSLFDQPTGIGHLGDDPAMMRTAIAYLERHASP
jgi:hypothetical protein